MIPRKYTSAERRAPRLRRLAVVTMLLCFSASALCDVSSARAQEMRDFAYRMQVITAGEAAEYRVQLPLSVYQKVVRADLGDLRVFNGNGEPVTFSLGHPAPQSVDPGAPVPLPTFALQDDSSASLEAVRVRIESGKGAVNVETSGGSPPAERVKTYLLDGKALSASVAALLLEWPEESADFAGRLRVEASDTLADWRPLAQAAPIANLHSGGERLVERRVEFVPTSAKYWRLAWVGRPAPFTLTGVRAEGARQTSELRRSELSVAGIAPARPPGEFEFDLGASLPVDRVNIELPETNTVAEIQVLSRARQSDVWHSVVHSGFYRLKGDDGELHNGPVPVAPDTDRHWLLRADNRGAGMGNRAPRLHVEWISHEIVFLARGAGPYYIAYGNVTAGPAAVSLAVIPKNVSVAEASLKAPESVGGESRLQAPPLPYPWKTAALWVVLIAGAALLAWMAYRLLKELR